MLFQQISVINASVALVIVEGEKNVSVSWTGDYPQILLTEELHLNDTNLNDTNDKCNNFARIASIGESCLNLSILLGLLLSDWPDIGLLC